METLFEYLVKSSALVAVFWIAYYLLLKRETFFQSNRWFLLSGLVTSAVLPLVTFTRIIIVEPSAKNYQWTSVPVGNAPGEIEINWWLVAAGFYCIGISILLVRFLIDFYSLNRTLNGKQVRRQADFKLVDTRDNLAPFSYFSYIVYNSELYTEQELANILAHEKVHSEQLHSIDVLAMRLFCIAFWFNPFVWLYRKSMLQNLEFIADSVAVKSIADKKSYQITLLKVTAHENCVSISNHFFQSLIKKRIVMLNKNQSDRWQSWKYALIIPVLAAFMLYFQVKVIAQEKQIIERDVVQSGVRVVVDKNTSDAEMKSDAKKLKEEHGVTLKFSKVKRNKSGEIVAIKAEFKDKNGKKGVTQVSGDEPIQPISFYRNDDGAIGFGSARESRIWHRGPGGSEQVFISVIDPEHAPDAPPAVEHPDMVEPPLAPHPDMPPAEMMERSKHVIITNKDGKHTVVVDGKLLTGEEADKVIADMEPLEGTYAYAFEAGDEDRVFINKKEIEKISKDASKRAKIEIKKMKPEMMRAREEMRKMRPEMEKAREALRKAQPEMERARREMIWHDSDASKAEMEQARKEMAQAKVEIERAREEIQKAKAEIEKARAEMEKEKTAKK